MAWDNAKAWSQPHSHKSVTYVDSGTNTVEGAGTAYHSQGMLGTRGAFAPEQDGHPVARMSIGGSGELSRVAGHADYIGGTLSDEGGVRCEGKCLECCFGCNSFVCFTQDSEQIACIRRPAGVASGMRYAEGRAIRPIVGPLDIALDHHNTDPEYTERCIPSCISTHPRLVLTDLKQAYTWYCNYDSLYGSATEGSGPVACFIRPAGKASGGPTSEGGAPLPLTRGLRCVIATQNAHVLRSMSQASLDATGGGVHKRSGHNTHFSLFRVGRIVRTRLPQQTLRGWPKGHMCSTCCTSTIVAAGVPSAQHQQNGTIPRVLSLSIGAPTGTENTGPASFARGVASSHRLPSLSSPYVRYEVIFFRAVLQVTPFPFFWNGSACRPATTRSAHVFQTVEHA